jgi:hypothetical protein
LNVPRLAIACLGILLAGSYHLDRADGVDKWIAEIAAVGPQGRGSVPAREACRHLSRLGPEMLPRLLSAMDTPNLVAANWYRAAYEQIVTREQAKSSPAFPMEAFKACVRDPRRQGRVRRLALALVDRVDPKFKTAFLPALLDDPEFRDEAVALALDRGDALQSRGEKTAARSAYETAFQHARDGEQVTAAARKLESLGEKVSIPAHFGLVTDWSLIGPFGAPGMTGFRTSFPPESSVDLAAVTKTSDKRGLRWVPYQTSDPFVDLVRALGPVDEAVGYAYTEVESPESHQAQIRCSADDCLAVWLNGQKVFGREMWLNGTRFDRFITPVEIKAGRNRVLVKVCQGPHHRDPAVGNAWTFQLRFCTADGQGLRLPSVLGARRQAMTERSDSSLPAK